MSHKKSLKFSFLGLLQGLLIVSGGIYGVKSSTVLSPSPAIAADGESFTLTCTYSGGRTVSGFRWALNDNTAAIILVPACTPFDTPGPPDSTLYEYACPDSKSSTFTVKQILNENNGNIWQCAAAVPGYELSNSVTITVQVAVNTVRLTPPTDPVTENKETLFTCETSASRPAANVSWYKDSSNGLKFEITNNISWSAEAVNDLEKVTSILKYTPSRTDSGSTIYCTAINIPGRTAVESATFRFDVQYSPDSPPSIEGYSNGDTYNIIESTGLLSCSVKGGNPLATLTWNCYNAGSAAVTTGTTVTKNITWTASRGQERSCTCLSSHPVAGTQSISVSVQVLYPPESPSFKIKGNTVPGQISFIKGMSRNVVCESSGKPNPDTYIWTKGGSIIRIGNTLTFSSIQKQDDGQYKCRAQNTMIPSSGVQQTGTNSSVVKITVLFAPTTPSLHYGNINGQTVRGSSIDVVRGDTFNIACKSEGQPDPNYRWSGQTSDNQILSITSINDNLGRTCTVTNIMHDAYGPIEQGLAMSTLTMNVLYPPSINDCKLSITAISPIAVTDSIDVIEGSTFTLTCIANSKPTASVSWSGPVTSSSATLTIDRISKQQNGTYTVIAGNTMIRTFGQSEPGRNAKHFKFTILYGPKIQVLNTKDIVAGSQLNFSCPVVKGNPPALNFKWTRNGDNKVWNKQILYIETINKNDDMIYTCTVQNTMKPTGAVPQHGEDSGSFHLNVLYKASITSFGIQGSGGPASVTVNEKENVPFICAVDSNPDSSIEIKFQGKILHRQDNTNKLTYIYKNAACLDAGVYICSSKNQYNYGEVSLKELTMYVKCSPRPLVPVKETVTSALRVAATLSFRGLAYPIPVPAGYTWKKQEGTKWKTLSNSSTVLITISGADTNITISNVSKSDYGMYQLVVQNEVNTYNQTFLLIPEGVPETPSEFKALEAYIMDTSVVLQWKPGFNGGPEQTFILLYKQTSDQTWKNVTVQDTKESTMNYTLTQLVSGSRYKGVIFARNRIGDSVSARNTTFSTTEHLQNEIEGNKSAIIGGVVGGIVLCTVTAGIVLFLYRRNIITGRGHTKKTSDTTTIRERQDYVDLQHPPSYDNTIPVYDSLQQEPGNTAPGSSQDVYMHLGTEARNDDKHIYTSLQQRQDNDDGKIVYVNLNLRRF